MPDLASQLPEPDRPPGFDVYLTDIAAHCNLDMPDQRDRLFSEVTRLFVVTDTLERGFREFLTAVADGNRPELLAELKRLLQKTSNDSARNRSEILDQWGRPSGITWLVAEGKLVATAPLSDLTVDFKLPVDFPEPIRYDRDRNQMLYRGYMCKSSYDFLRTLHRGADYQRALEVLYRDSSQNWLAKQKVLRNDSLFQRLLHKLGLR